MLLNQLYRIFYVIFAMELVAVALFPVMLVLRFLMRNIPKKYMVWVWRLYFLRIICPLSISSTFSIVPAWNRIYHQILAALGLTIQGDFGFLTGWHTVFEAEIETTFSYRICACVWLAGVVVLMGTTWICQSRMRREVRKDAVRLEGRIYQAAVQTPVMAGIFRCRYYLPKQTQAKQLRHLLTHLEAQRKRKSHWWRLAGFAILLLHWFDPVVWFAYALAKKEEEMACDDLTVQCLGEKESLLYAQSLLNMAKETAVIPYTVSTIFEQDLENRSARMLYYRPYIRRQHISGVLILLLLLFWSFGLRPLQIAWNGGTWVQERPADAERSQMPENAGDVVEQCVTLSPSGLELVLRLVMTSGECTNGTYRGQFALELQNSIGDTLMKLPLNKLWEEQGLSSDLMRFPQDLTFQTGDYNGDGARELLLGQQIDWSGEQTKTVKDALFQTEDTSGETEYIYLMFHIGEKDLTVVSDSIYALGDKGQEAAVPLIEQDIKDLFAVQVPQGKNYYVWDADKQRYSLQKMTQEQLNQHKAASSGSAEAGHQETKTLTDSAGKVQMTVETKSDTTGSLAIQSIQVGKEGQQVEMEKVDGYYCDLIWATEEKGTSDRYAVLIYNGTKAQTFIIYDVQQKKVYYQQEDGNGMLAKVFKQYNGSEISFAEGGVVIYSLLSIEEDVLNINFAANADNGITVRGSYKYHLADKGMTDLSFSQTTDQTDAN